MTWTWSDALAWGYIGLSGLGAIASPLSREFPEQKWIATVARVCGTLGAHWGIIAAILSRGGLNGMGLPADHAPPVPPDDRASITDVTDIGAPDAGPSAGASANKGDGSK